MKIIYIKKFYMKLNLKVNVKRETRWDLKLVTEQKKLMSA